MDIQYFTKNPGIFRGKIWQTFERTYFNYFVRLYELFLVVTLGDGEKEIPGKEETQVMWQACIIPISPVDLGRLNPVIKIKTIMVRMPTIKGISKKEIDLENIFNMEKNELNIVLVSGFEFKKPFISGK